MVRSTSEAGGASGVEGTGWPSSSRTMFSSQLEEVEEGVWIRDWGTSAREGGTGLALHYLK